jgi:hypothetical protein
MALKKKKSFDHVPSKNVHSRFPVASMTCVQMLNTKDGNWTSWRELRNIQSLNNCSCLPSRGINNSLGVAQQKMEAQSVCL